MRAGHDPRVLDHCPTCFVEWNRSEQDHARQRELKYFVGALRYFSNKPTQEELASGSFWTVQLVIEDEPGGSE